MLDRLAECSWTIYLEKYLIKVKFYTLYWKEY